MVGIGLHRDGVASSHARRVLSPGHKWVTLAVAVRLPLCTRPTTEHDIPPPANLHNGESRVYNSEINRRHSDPPLVAFAAAPTVL